MENGKSNAGLYAKIAQVMGEIGELEKKGRNAHFGYEFIRDVDVANAVRPLLAAHSVALFVGMEDVSQRTVTSGRGDEGSHTLVRMSLTFADGETGATMTVPWYGEAIDYQDKSVNKCATAAVKYALMKTFLIGTDDDPDAAETPRSSGTRQARSSGNGAGSAATGDILKTDLSFGKFKGKTLGYVLENEPSYLEWLAENWQWDKGRAMAQTLVDRIDNPGPGAQNGPPPDAENTSGGDIGPTEYWQLAKKLQAQGAVEADQVNTIKRSHETDDGIDWAAAFAELSEISPY